MDVPSLVSFGEDAGGRVYTASLGGTVSRLVPGPEAGGVALAAVGVFRSPIFVAGPPGDPTRVMVVEQGGRVRVLRNGLALSKPFIDLGKKVGGGGEGGLLSIAFAPDYASSGLVYAYYTDPRGDIRVDELRRSRSNADRTDAKSRRSVISIPHRSFSNHKGGQLQFGPDGLLYVGTGDGGAVATRFATART